MEDLSSPINPMLNQVVLARLFELCDLSDLPRFRLVSKQWHANSLKRFRNEMTVVLNCRPIGYRDIRKSCLYTLDLDAEDNLGQRKFLVWKSFLENLDAIEDNPFNSFRIKYIKLSPRPSSWTTPIKPATKMYKKINRFWKDYGSWIRKLELWRPLVHRVGSFKKVIFHATPNLEELHLIEIENKSGYDPEDWEEDEEEYRRVKEQPNLKRLVVKAPSTLPITWKLLFAHFPNLENYELTLTERDSWPLRVLLRHFKDISKLVKPEKHFKVAVPTLNLTIWNADSSFFAMALLQLPQLILSNIYLNVRNCGTADGRNLLSTLFLQHGDTLEEVHVITGAGAGSGISLNQQIGPFNLMTKLELTGNGFKNMDFLAQFPNLTFLGMVQSDEKMFDETNWGRLEDVKMHKLKHFSFLGKCHIPRDAMERLVKLMPNVEIFCGKVSNESLRVVCLAWRQLRSLSIGTVSNDPEACLNSEGITGVVEGCAERLPNIVDLNDLNYLRIQNEDGINEASGRERVLEMLHRVHQQSEQSVRLELPVEIKEDACQSMRIQFPVSSYRSRVVCIPYFGDWTTMLSTSTLFNVSVSERTSLSSLQDKWALQYLSEWIRKQKTKPKKPPFFVRKPAKIFRECRSKGKISRFGKQ